MSKYRFSIIVPIYQVEAYLERCLDSLVRQTFSEYEIVLVDDGSKDRSGEICDQYAVQNANIKVYHKENGGLSSARNYGIDHASGKYVLFVDSDDYVEEGLCRALQKVTESCPDVDAIVYGGIEQKDEEIIREIRRINPEKIQVWNAHEYMKNAYQQRNMDVQAWLYAYRKDFLDENGLRFKEGILHEDVEFTPRALLKANQIAELPGNYYHYMVREGSISTTKNWSKNIRDLFQTLEEQSVLAGDQEPELRKWMQNAVLNSYLNMIYEARMYRTEYRKYIDKSFLRGKAATSWNKVRVLLCTVSVRLYCMVNDSYKKLRG